eukprot:Em0020g631a
MGVTTSAPATLTNATPTNPVNLLGSTPFRFVYAIILSALAADVLQNILDKSTYYRSSQGFVDALYYYVFSVARIFFEQAVAYFPVLACVDAPIPVLGHCIGFMYTCLLGGKNIYSEVLLVRGCSSRGVLSNRDIGISLGIKVPIYVYYLVIAVWFFCHGVMKLALLPGSLISPTKQVKECDIIEQHINYVKVLLRRPPVKQNRWPPHAPIEAVWTNFVRGMKHVLPFKSNFKYPLPFLGAVLIAYTMLYQLVVLFTANEIIFADNLKSFVLGMNITVQLVSKLLPLEAPKVTTLFENAVRFAEAYQVILPLGSIIGYGLTCLFTLYMIMMVHKQMVCAARGDTSFLVRSEPLPSPAYRLAAAMRYCSFQVGYIVMSWFFYTVLLWILFSFGLFWFYAFKDYAHNAIHLFSWGLVPFGWSMAVYYFQIVVCKLLFVEKGSGKFVLVKHRRLLQVVTYFIFFYNVMFGAVMCFLRALGVVMFIMVSSFRLDKDVYMRGMEGWDLGNRTYVGYVYMECTQNHPVLHAFIEVLRTAAKQRADSRREHEECQDNETGSSETTRLLGSGSVTEHINACSGAAALHVGHSEAAACPRVSRRALNRWLVAYTILRNPELQTLTAQSTNLHQTNSI